ncbi:hypothetical protein CC99x_007335 [Candidatus Berkiella cookevillensis]|uniref:Uncharacterized protein n=1 Tax=Candidatus Berkiella cookevillensis TaxID=437022 RepID=A0A0Q9YLY5_9GAMM|nr:hypothetical protein [Candidatus Berkiella cookevillensis]MCS5708715.1 hypothetical protein [Candidatus Berkiella cookevillensis]
MALKAISSSAIFISVVLIGFLVMMLFYSAVLLQDLWKVVYAHCKATKE